MKTMKPKHRWVATLLSMVWCLVGARATADEGSAFWSSLERGAYEVGFERLELVDHSRPFRDDGPEHERPRRVLVSVWYPAERAAGDGSGSESESWGGGDGKATFQSYVEGDERRFDEWSRAAGGRHVSDKTLRKILDSETLSAAGAPRARGPFPLLLFGSGLSAPAYVHSALSEYLANHGYVCVAVPSMPPRADVEPSRDARNIEGHVRDYELVLQELHDYPETDPTRIGLVAWSMSGAAQAILAMKNANVKALVSLDAATGYPYGQRLVEESLHYDPSRASAHLLHITGPEDSMGTARKSFEFYESVSRGPAYMLRVDGLTHGQFTSLASVVLHTHLGLPESANILQQYGRACLYVRHFLDAAIRDGEDAARFFDVAPSRHGFEGIVLSRRR
jgi:hypothetical protein